MGTTTETVLTFLGPLLAGGVGVELVRWARSRMESRRRQGVPDAIERTARIYDTIQEVLRLSGAQRVLVLRANNGEIIPQPGAQLYSTAVYETTRGSTPPVRQRWQARPLDRQYTELMMELLKARQVTLRTETIAPGALRNVYESTGVLASDVHLLACVPGQVWYLSVVHDAESVAGLEDASYRATVESAVQRLASLLGG